MLLVSLLVPSGLGQAKKHPKAPHSSARSKKKKKNVKHPTPAQAKRLNRAFTASAELKPMAKQMLETHSKASHAGVEAFARRHSNDDAGALAWLACGYVHWQDRDYENAIADLRQAKPRARELADYVDFYLASAYSATNDPQDVILTLDQFGTKYPASPLVREAAVMRAQALIQTDAFERAIDVLEAYRKPLRPEVELPLGMAYAASGRQQKAIEIFRNLYYSVPLSAESEEAGKRLQQLPFTPARDERKQRADLLLKGRRYATAIVELQQLQREDPTDTATAVQLGYAFMKANRDAEAKAALTNITATDSEVAAQRLYALVEVARDEQDTYSLTNWLAMLRDSAPKSGWLQQALLSAGNFYLLRNDLPSAYGYYSEIAERFPDSRLAGLMHWKAAWLNYRMGKRPEAAAQFEEQIARFSGSNEVANALYWRGRIAESENNASLARAYYAKLAERFRFYYYANLGRERLRALGPGPVASEPLLDKVPQLGNPAKFLDSAADVDDVRLLRANLLANAALYDLAVKELENARADGQNDWAVGEIARLQTEAGKPNIALQTLKRAIPSYFALDVNSIPRRYWEVLFPRPYWTDLERNARDNGLDPFLVASLIRQESEFNAGALSHADAYGLMQLLPSVGKQLAKQEHVRHYSTGSLFDPAVNLKLGTRYFKQMVAETGSVEYALAAYNAGTNRVTDWKASGTFTDLPEFVESIPFTETREYVQAILRNEQMYKTLYAR
jgi:soluble lytic murein transglycosylase